ncbi:sensor histidine kinase, partial [Enterococcus faecalis]
ENNIYFSIEDEQGNMVWELKGKNLKSAQDKLKKNALKVSEKKSVKLDETIEAKKKLINDGNEFGKVTFYNFAPFAYTENDALFICTMIQSLMYVVIAAL